MLAFNLGGTLLLQDPGPNHFLVSMGSLIELSRWKRKSYAGPLWLQMKSLHHMDVVFLAHTESSSDWRSDFPPVATQSSFQIIDQVKMWAKKTNFYIKLPIHRSSGKLFPPIRAQISLVQTCLKPSVPLCREYMSVLSASEWNISGVIYFVKHSYGFRWPVIFIRGISNAVWMAANGLWRHVISCWLVSAMLHSSPYFFTSYHPYALLSVLYYHCISLHTKSAFFSSPESKDSITGN